MTLRLKWVWELTPSQIFQKNRFVKSSGTQHLFQELRGFSSPRNLLTGTDYTYQVALSRVGRTEESMELAAMHPNIPDSGDYRSGVLVFHDGEIIGSLILSGVNAKQPFKMVVSPEYRQQGLAERMLVEWWSHVKHTYRTEADQAMTLASVKVLLGAYETVVNKAVAEGRPVSIQVQQALANGVEAAQVLQTAQAAENE